MAAELTQGTVVLIADGEKALFLRNMTDPMDPHLVVMGKEEQDNPSDIEQSANRPGRMKDTGVGQVSALDDTDWHELAKERFAADLADKLYHQAHDGKFDRLIVAAAPKVLGELRKELHKEVTSRIVGELDKDLTNHQLDQIEKVLHSEFGEARH
ncbi:Host attachment protein [Aquicoccus sp. SCR17]|nr:Host attachment protein [Carideicomes alvinocaridis]